MRTFYTNVGEALKALNPLIWRLVGRRWRFVVVCYVVTSLQYTTR